MHMRMYEYRIILVRNTNTHTYFMYTYAYIYVFTPVSTHYYAHMLISHALIQRHAPHTSVCLLGCTCTLQTHNTHTDAIEEYTHLIQAFAFWIAKVSKEQPSRLGDANNSLVICIHVCM